MSDEKTEQPTAKRLRDAREKGEVTKSQDLTAAFSILAIGMYLLAKGPDILGQLLRMVEVVFSSMTLPYDLALRRVTLEVMDVSLSILLPLMATVLGLVLAGLLIQVGFLFAFEGAKPKLENLNPQQWFKKVFAVKNLFELVKNILKVLILGIATVLILQDYLSDLFRSMDGQILQLWSLLGTISLRLILVCACLFTVLAVADYFFQRWQFMKGKMMSKDEVKREYKESEGDPMIKGKRKQLHQELLQQNNMDRVRKAKVLVVNPTHYAVALDYETGRTPLPIVLCKGEGYLAQQMIAVAKEANVPIMRNVDLAHALYNDGVEGSYIPKDLIGPVAEVLRWVEGLGK